MFFCVIDFIKDDVITDKHTAVVSILGICGVGCPIQAMNSKEGNTIHSLYEIKNHPIFHDMINIEIEDLCVDENNRGKGADSSCTYTFIPNIVC